MSYDLKSGLNQQECLMGFGKLGSLGRGFGHLGSLAGSGSPYTSEANVLFAAMTTPPADARKVLINNLIVSLKASGVWALTDCLYVLAAADSQAARLNWKAPGTFTASPVNSPAFTVDRGFTGDGATSVLDSQYNPVTSGGVGLLNSYHLGLWDRLDNSIAGNPPVGNLNTTLQNKVGAVGTISARANAGGTVSSVGVPTGAMNHYVVNRNNSSTHDVWGAGSKIVSAAASASSSMSSLTMTLLGRQIAAASYQFSPRQMSAFHWGAALSDAQIASTYSALATYMTAIGA